MGGCSTVFAAWGDEHDYDSVQEMRATMCLARSKNPKAFARGNYRHMLRAATRPLNFSRAGH
jgi:hypothetical protein